MTLSVIIPSFQGAHKFPRLLEGLSKQTRMPEEIILVLDGSTDNSETVAKEWQKCLPMLKVLFMPNGGRAGARNTGARAAKGSVLIFLDDDVVIPPNLIELHSDFHKTQRTPSVLMGLTLVRMAGNTGPLHQYRCRLEAGWENQQKGRILLQKNAFSCSAANLSMPVGVFMVIKGFDPRLTDAEDWELGARLLLNNTPMYQDSNLTIGHMDTPDLDSFIKRQVDHYQSKMVLADLFPHYMLHFPHYFTFLNIPSGWKQWLRNMYPYTCMHPLLRQNLSVFPFRLVSFHIHTGVLRTIGKL